MKKLTFLAIGIFFGILLYKSEAASWFRIYEMFRFGSFHMYGIMGSAVVTGFIGIQLMKKFNIKPIWGHHLQLQPKDRSVARYLFGGIIFGLGWALAGSCPGPMYVLAGAGYYSILIVLFGALIGTYLYGVLKKYLPH
ncbi:MAG: DUF6691 family protein [Flavobacteriaceae bacterium]|nr:DUF6691 family protein [Flavobacteriaceae bacterium]